MAVFAAYLQRIKRGAILNILVQMLVNFGLGFAAYFFKIRGVEFYKIILVSAIGPLASLPVVMLANNWNIRRYLRYGGLAYSGMALSLLFFNRYSFLLYGIFSGLALGFFWVSFNYVFFLSSTNEHHAKDSSIYFILGPLASIVLPPIGALVIHGLGFRVLFSITLLLSFLPLLYVRGENFNFQLKQDWRQAERNFNGLRLITFYDATLHFFQGGFLMIYTLLFLKTEYQVGGLLSYLGFISLLVSFLLAHISDKYKKRAVILYPLLIVMAGLILIMPALKSLTALVALIGVYAVFDNLSLPIRFAIPLDLVGKDIGFWRASEFYGNLGRTVVFAVASLSLYLGNYWLPFIIFSLMALSFPFIISHKIKIFRR